MRIFISAVIIFFFGSLAFGQTPTNDDCDDPIDLGTTPFCDSMTLYNNFNATSSDIGQNNIPPCFKGGSSDFDVWFTFTTTTAAEYIFTVMGVEDTSRVDSQSMKTPQVEIYSGSCQTDQLVASNNCQSAPNGSTSLKFNAGNLLDNQTYFLRITNGGDTVNTGNFYICVEELYDELSVDMVGSPLCSGRVYDTGGPDSTYNNNEDHIFTICPDSAHACLTLNLGRYELETKPGSGDYFMIFDGADTTGVLIGSSIDMRNSDKVSDFSGINNANCQTYHASSGCITILWHTDSSVVANGFDATWECSLDTCVTYDSISISVGPSDDDIINSVQGQLIEIEVGSINCIDSAFAVYDGDKTDTQLAKGLLLTTGRADSVAGPNDLPNYGYKNDTTGIALLDSLSMIYGDSTTTHDGCAVELDFTPETDVMALEFTLGSEEYTECLVEQLTDILGLFYTTAGHNGVSRLNNYTNMALFPSQSMNPDEIQIFRASPNDSTYWEFYRNNLNSQSIEYDGMLTSQGGNKFVLLTQNVEPCQSNLLMAAIADRGDSLYDSGIFISNMRCLTPSIGFTSSLGLNFFIETCNPGEDFLVFNFPRNYDDDTQWDVTFEGAAQQGSDFIWTHGSKITLPAGQSSVRLEIDVVDDGIEEGSETFKIKLTRDWGCGEVELTELDVTIRDRLIADIQGHDPIACLGEKIDLFAVGDNDLLDMTWQPTSLFGTSPQDRISFLATTDIQIILTGTIKHPAGCTWSDTLDIEVLDPQVDITTNDPLGICAGETVTLTAVGNEDVDSYLWRVIPFSPGSINNPTNEQIIFTGINRGTFQVSVRVDTLHCEDVETVTIVVDKLDQLNIIDDMTICFGDGINLTTNMPGGNPTYNWTPPETLDDPTSHNPLASPTKNTTYHVDITSEHGFCTDSGSVTINVIPEFFPEISDPGFPCRDSIFQLTETGIPDSILNNYNVSFQWTALENSMVIGNSTDRTCEFQIGKDDAIIELSIMVEDCEIILSKIVEISDPGPFNWTIDPDSTIADCADLEIQVTVGPGGTSTFDASSIVWFFLDSLDVNRENPDFFGEGILNPTYRVTKSGKLVISLNDSNGCYWENSQDVIVKSPILNIPKAFTPNRDGINDVFKVFYDDEDFDYDLRSIKIFNRWGVLVYESNNNDGWDGKYKGDDALSGVYLWTIEMVNSCGVPVQSKDIHSRNPENKIEYLQGDVTLIR